MPSPQYFFLATLLIAVFMALAVDAAPIPTGTNMPPGFPKSEFGILTPVSPRRHRPHGHRRGLAERQQPAKVRGWSVRLLAFTRILEAALTPITLDSGPWPPKDARPDRRRRRLGRWSLVVSRNTVS